MKAHKLVDRLWELFPQGFGNPDAMEGWGEIYIDTLKPYEGEILQRAFKQMMASWVKGYPPKPGEFAQLCGQMRRELQEHRELSSAAPVRRLRQDNYPPERVAEILGEWLTPEEGARLRELLLKPTEFRSTAERDEIFNLAKTSSHRCSSARGRPIKLPPIKPAYLRNGPSVMAEPARERTIDESPIDR